MKLYARTSLVIICFTLMVCLAFPVLIQLSFGQEKGRTDIVVLVSKRIRPYADTLKGSSRFFQEKKLTHREFWINDDKEFLDSFKATLAGLSPQLLLTIGPEALILAGSLSAVDPRPVIHTVVLNPGIVIGENSLFCGISLEIPLERQITDITTTLPDIKTVGLLIDPKYNQKFYDQACGFCSEKEVDILSLSVSSKTEIPEVLEKHWNLMDAVWMIPDRTVISERIVQYVIRKGIAKKKPVIGFNRFFYESGAVLAFEFDYERLGAQAGELSYTRLTTGMCSNLDPVYSLSVNNKVAQKINVRVLDTVQKGEGQ